MRERRMFAKTIITSDAFLDMPATARCLYFTLAMFADDDGFVNNPKGILRSCGCSTDDMNILVAKKFILLFEDGVIVIKHWRIHNLIRQDRYIQTNYEGHKRMLELDENNAYRFKEKNKFGIPSDNQVTTNGIPSDNQVTTQYNISKYNINNNKYICDSKVTKNNLNVNFIKPTIEEINQYCIEKCYNIDAEKFYNFYEAKGWMIGKNKMKNWKSALTVWNRSNVNNNEVKAKNKVQAPTPDWYIDYLASLDGNPKNDNSSNNDVDIEQLKKTAKGLFED